MGFDPAESDTVALFTPIPNGRVLAAVCAVNGLKGRVLETSAGAFAVLDDTSDGATEKAGEVLSGFVKDRPILALERRSGQISVTQWQAGVAVEKLAPGFALDDAPGAVVSLITGSQTMDDLAAVHPDKVFDARMGRVKAFRELRGLSKDAQRQAKEQP
ncbi:hypothetical protein [Demequina sp.]|uniref:hypothetical protein n=1 Tax=Demequina sp. TaxID=2050685 RepID=UPI003D13268E